MMLKKLLGALSRRPLKRLFSFASRLGQLGAYLGLNAQLPDGAPASVVALGMPQLAGSRNIGLGRELYLYPALHLETQAGGRIEIGDRVVMSRGVHVVAFAHVAIGAGSMIGEYASIRDAQHNTGGCLRDAGHRAAPVRIGRNVWIGRGAAILSGVTIGDDAVIGANAVVTHDVPAGATWAGVPARPLKRSPR